MGVLRRTTHNGFPVVGHPDGVVWGEASPPAFVNSPSNGSLDTGASRKGPFCGLILRSQLLVLLAEQVRHLSQP